MYYNGKEFKTLKEYVEQRNKECTGDKYENEIWAIQEYIGSCGLEKEEDISFLEQNGYDPCDFYDHYEVQTLSSEYGEVESSNIFFRYNEAKEFYDSLNDKYKMLLKVDEDGMPYEDDNGEVIASF